MNVYHGSDVIVEKPQILQSNRLLDFGIGFYTTSNKEQAIRWAEKVSIRNNTGDESWLNFITANRGGKEIPEEYDIIIGPVADDNVYLTVKLFETGVLNKEEAVERLKVEKLFNQILFHTEKALEFCMFDHYIDLEGK